MSISDDDDNYYGDDYSEDDFDYDTFSPDNFQAEVDVWDRVGGGEIGKPLTMQDKINEKHLNKG